MQTQANTASVDWRTKPANVIPARKPRYFFVGIAILFLGIVFMGFWPSYQAMKSDILKPHWVIHVHSVIMTGWLLLFLTQSLLVARSNIRLHRKLGIFAFGWGLAVIAVMIWATLQTLVYNHPPEPDFLFDLLLFQLYGLIVFTAYFIGAWVTRKTNASAHKRFLMLGTMVLLQAAINRTRWLPMFGQDPTIVYFIYLDLIFIPLLVYDYLSLRRIHRVTWMGALFIILVQAGVYKMLGSPSWHSFWYNATLPLMTQTVEVSSTEANMKSLEGSYMGPIFPIQILAEDGKLFMQAPGQPKQTMGASSDSTWFSRVSSQTIRFKKDASGKIAGMVFRLGYGEEFYQRLP